MSQTPAEAPETAGGNQKDKLSSRQRLLNAARKLFVQRGYHATRPQDISKEAALGYGTFYLHFKDKRECFLAFVEEARAEVDAAMIERAGKARDLPEMVEAVLLAIYDYSESNPGVLATAMSDEAVISAETAQGTTLLQRWGEQWGNVLKAQAAQGLVASDFDYDVIGQAVVGAIQQASAYSYERGRSRAALVNALSKFIVRGLTPSR